LVFTTPAVCGVVGRRNQLIERDQLDAVFARQCRRHKRIAANDLEAESLRTLGHFQANAPQPENAQRLAAQLRALQAFLLPFAGVHGAVGRG